MIQINMNMPRFCSECPFVLMVKDTCAYCMATKYQIKISEVDLKDGLCPLMEVEGCLESNG